MPRNTDIYAYFEVSIRKASPGYLRLVAEARRRGVTVGKILNMVLPGLLEVPDIWNPTAPTPVQAVPQSESAQEQRAAPPVTGNPAARAAASMLGVLGDEHESEHSQEQR